MNRKIILIILLAGGVVSASFSQNIEQVLSRYNILFPQEKVYIHFDNQSYMPGVLVGFKAYLMQGPELSKISHNFYTDWYDEQGQLLSHQSGPITLSSAYGTFQIPKEYKGRALYVTAYTSFMLNADTTLLFHKKIPVLQPATQPVTRNPVATTYLLRFFPEGGDLVNGVTSQVAFKAYDENGDPIAVQGKIMNDKQEEVASFESVHDGMGKLLLKPETGVAYTAEWTAPDGVLKKTSLMPALQEGISMKLTGLGITRYLEVERSAQLPAINRKLLLLVTMNQQTVMKGDVNLEEKTKSVSRIPIHNIPSGIATITLFNQLQQPVAERVMFIDNEEYLTDVSIRFDAIGLGKREKNIFEIQLNDTLSANLSLSVTNEDVPVDSSENIISAMLLSADLKGNIHNPAYYFDPSNDSAKQYLDLVMLTNGWRRLIWKQVLDSSMWKQRVLPEGNHLSITGKIDGVNANRLTKAGTMNMILKIKDSSSQMFFTPVASSGYFKEPDVLFYDTALLYYQVNKIPFLPGRGKITIHTNLLDIAFRNSIWPAASFRYDTAWLSKQKEAVAEQERIRLLQQGTTLEEVVVSSKIKSRSEEMEDTYVNSGMFRSGDAYSFDMLTDPRALSSFSVFDYLVGRVAGLQINGARTPNPTASWRNAPVSFFLNEMPVDVQSLSGIPVIDIAYMKVFRPPFMGGVGGGAGGAIAVYTKKGNDPYNDVTGMLHVPIAGYTLVKEFYEPDYSKPQQNFAKTDARRTLFWRPNLVTNGAVQRIRIEFYNNDISRKLRLTLQGVNNAGQFISVRKLLE